MNVADKSIWRASVLTNKKQAEQEAAEQMQSQQQQAQQQAEQQEKMDNSKIMASYAKAKSDLAREKDLMASAQERIAKVEDINATAQHKEIESDLNLVKLAMELEDVQFNQFRAAFEFAHATKMANQSQVTQPA